MDPNEALRACRVKAERILMDYDAENQISEDDAEALAHFFTALDGWLSKGGFPPEAWKQSKF